MALYAFDGTWNEDEIDDATDTNVVRFREVYAGPEFEYLTGVGTRLSAVGRALGGLFGLGGRSRIDDMYDLLSENWRKGDHVIDLIGFSRGAALAVHFANKIAEDGIREKNGKVAKPRIRFLGLWDVVASFGLSFNNILPFQEINLGWDVKKVADNVDHCFHAMALDERRESFGITRLNPKHTLANVTEVWFRGVHSDIGGGNGNEARSNIALQWMIDNARASGVPINEVRAKEPHYAAFDTDAPISENKDLKRDKRRKVLAGDELHPTARPRELAVGQSRKCRVLARLHYNWSGVALVDGATYRIESKPKQKWRDGEIECGAEGWTSKQLPWAKEKIVKAFEGRRRSKKANWFELIGAIGDEDKDLFRIGQSVEHKAKKAGDLYLFANDLQSKYGNNDGFLDVTITRIA